MAAKTRILKENFITRKAGWVQFYDSDGSIKKLRSNEVELVDSLDQPAVEDSRRDMAAEDQAATDAEVLTDSDAGADEPAAAPGRSKTKRAGRAKEKSMATKKAGKKAAKKAAAKSNGQTLRTVGGRQHDISGYERVKNASGHVSFDNGDDVASKLRGKTLDEVYEIVGKKLGESVKDLKAKYKHLNAGMQRMSLGNRMRKVVNAAA